MFLSHFIEPQYFKDGDPFDCPTSPGTCTSSQGPTPSLPSLHFPSKMKVTGEHSHHLSQSGGHVPASAPEQQTSTTTFIFEGRSGRRAVCAGSPVTVLPQSKGVMALPPTFSQKNISSQNLTVACSEQGDMSPPQPLNSRPLP